MFVKDNHGKVTLVSRKDVSPCEMDVKIAELFNESRSNSKIRDAQQLMPARQIPDLEWKFEEEVQLVEPVSVQIYHLPEQPVTTENDRPGRSEVKILESSATAENDRPHHSPTKVQRLLTATENDRPECLQLVKAKKTENQVNHDTNTHQEDQRVVTIETDRTVCSQMTASESSALKILETLIFLLVSLATVAILF